MCPLAMGNRLYALKGAAVVNLLQTPMLHKKDGTGMIEQIRPKSGRLNVKLIYYCANPKQIRLYCWIHSEQKSVHYCRSHPPA